MPGTKIKDRLSAEKFDRAVRLWNAGKSASEVAAAIGCSSRNVILGLSHRNRDRFQRKAEPRFRP